MSLHQLQTPDWKRIRNLFLLSQVKRCRDDWRHNDLRLSQHKSEARSRTSLLFKMRHHAVLVSIHRTPGSWHCSGVLRRWRATRANLLGYTQEEGALAHSPAGLEGPFRVKQTPNPSINRTANGVPQLLASASAVPPLAAGYLKR